MKGSRGDDQLKEEMLQLQIANLLNQNHPVIPIFTSIIRRYGIKFLTNNVKKALLGIAEL